MDKEFENTSAGKVLAYGVESHPRRLRKWMMLFPILLALDAHALPEAWESLCTAYF